MVCSEVLYYLDPADLDQVVERIAGAARTGRGRGAGALDRAGPRGPAGRRATHRRFLDDPRFTPVVEHVDAEFLLHVVRCG